MTKSIEEIRDEFIEKIGLLMQSDGLPRTAGRVMGALVWEGSPVAFCDLATELQVSRGSISTATRALIDRRMIRRVTKPGDRQDYFQLAEKSYETMVEDLSLKFHRRSEELYATLDGVPECEPEIRERVRAYSETLESVAKKIGELVKEMV
ncbi:GbsR/MarR family transcriptional regulator [Vannielia sp. SX4]|uniref:GbsR/MarR family transcriptional regulator n=1 Tax=Vannielia sp. SX4 TaxID=3463852 RepID=UPI004058E56A